MTCNNDDAARDPEIAELRARILEDLTPLPSFAKAMNKSVRAVQRMVRAGQVRARRFGSSTYIEVPRKSP